MQAQDINAFIKAVKSVCAAMLQLHIEPGEPRLKTDPMIEHDVSGIIGMSGDVTGAVAISFPMETAERMVSIFIGMDITSDHEDFADAIGELVNIVTGNAKTELDGNIAISCPSVVIGRGHRITTQKSQPLIEIPLECECGTLSMEVAVNHTPKPQAIPA